MATYKRDFILSGGIGVSANDIYLSSATNSTTINTGSFITPGGVGIGQSVSLGGRLQLFNNSNYTAFVSSASENTVYTLPATSPATGSSVLSSTSGGTLSWVPLVASGEDTYLVNVNAATGNTVLFIAGLNDDIGSGLAVSSNTNLTYDTNTNKLNSPFYTGTWAGSTITTLYGGTGLSAYTKGDLLVGLGDTLYKLPVGTQGQLLQAFSSATSGIAWTSIMPPTYGAFYSTQSQTVYGVGITTPITLNSTYEAYNTQILGGSGTSSRIQIQTAGTYNVQFSAQMHLTNGTQPKKGDFWFRINGVDVPQSNTQNTISGKDYQTVISLNFISYFAANDYFEIVMSSSDQYFTVEALSGLTSPPRPDIPSMIVTVVPVTQVVGSSAGLGVSGVVSINGLNQYIQYFATGKTGTDFNISSSNFTHTFNIPIAGTGATGLLTSQAQTIGGSKTFANDTIISSTTNSTSSATGALTVTGGVGIGGSLYVASATAISGVSINNGIITGDLIGNVTGFASTSRNVNLVTTSTATPHYLVFSPNASGSGVALSSGSSITVNPNSNVLSIGTGTFAANGVSVGSASNTINTASGNLNIDSFGGQTNLNDNVVISGNLTVQGTTITVDSTVSTFVDPVIVIGSGVGGTHSTLDSNQDRGFEFRWSNSGTAITGFFGFSDLDGKFRFIPQVSSIISNVYTGTAGTAVFTTVEANLSGNSTGTASTYTNFYGTLNGNVIGNVTGNLTGTATTATNVYLAVGANASSHSVIFSPSASGSGVALSSDTTFTYNPNTDTLTVSNIIGTATTATYAHQAGYAITSGSASIATTATYAHQAGYAITSGSASIATTATYAHQAGYAITSGSSNSSGSAITSNNIAIQNGFNNSTHSVIFAPAISGSGIALSSNQTITFNPSTSIFSASGIAVTANTNSTLTSTGAAIITGGVGIGQSLSIAGRLQLFNGSNYSAFVYTGSGNTVYTLPTTSPAIGNSVLQSTSGGILSWVPMVASSSSGTTAQNIFINAAGTADIFHQLLFTPAQQSAGSAVSSDVLLSFNANSDRLFASGISVTSGAASTSPFTGALQVTGGLGVSGQATFARASLGFTGVSVTPVMSFIGATTAPIISLSVLNDNSLSFEGSSGQLFSIDNNLSTGEIFSVSDISGLPIIAASAGQTVTINEFGGVTKVGDGTVNASSSSNAVLVVSGGLGVTGNAFIGGTTSITNSATSTSTTTGALVVTGGVGIGGSLYTATSVPSSISGVVLSNSIVRTGTWAATAITSFYGGTGHSIYTSGDLLVGAGSTLAKLPASSNSGWVLTSTGANSIPSWQAVPASAASSVAVSTSAVDQSFFITFVNVSSGSGLGLTTTTSFVVNPSSGLVTASGLALTSLANSSSTTTGTLRVSGGLGLTGNAFIGGTINASSASQSNISNVYFSNGNITGTSVTATTFQGNLIGTATTGTNIHLASTGNVAGPFYLIMSANSTGSGVALSSDTSLQYNSATDVLTVPNISGTAITATSFSGSLFGNVTGTATTATNIHLAVGANNTNHSVIFSLLSSGSGIALSSDTTLLYNPNTDTLSSTNFSGALSGNVTGTATTSTNVHLVAGNNNINHSVIFSLVSSGSGVALSSDSALVYNPNTDTLSSTNFSGTLVGNSATATTAANINTVSTSSSNLHYLLFSNRDGGSGVAVSSDTTVTLQPSTNILSVGTGQFAANGITVGSASNTINTASGNLTLDSAGGQTNLNDNVVISGNLTVQGTTITVDSTISTIVDPVIVVGSGVGGTHTTLDNNQDRGIEFRWSNSGVATTGFFGFNDNDGKFRFIPNATIPSANVYSGTAGTAVFFQVEATLAGNSAGSASTYTNFYGTLTGTATTAITATNIHLAAGANASNHSVIFSPSSTGSGVALSTDSTLTYNPNTDTLTSTNFAGNLSGNVTGNVTGFATTALNINVANAAANSLHTIYFGPSATGSGIAVSSNPTISFNPSSFILSTSGLAVTATTASTNSTSGALVVTGGVGIGDSLFVAGNISVNSGTNGLLFRKLVSGNYGAIYSTNITPSATNYTMITDGASVNFNGTNGVYFNINNTNKIQVTSNNINIVPTADSNSSSTGAFTVAGGVGIGGSLYVASATGISGVSINNGVVIGNLTGDVTGFATTARNVNVSNSTANSPHTIYFGPTATGSGVALSSNRTLSFNPSSFILSTSGLAVTSTAVSTNATSGALIVSGGVGIGGTLNIDGNVKINFTNHTAFNVSDVFTVYPVNNFEGANIKSNYSYAFNVQDKSNNNRFTVDVGNNKTILSGNTFSHELRIYNANQVGYTGFVAASSGTVTYTLPAGDGSANFLLKTDGAGALSWTNISGLAVTNINGINASYQYLAYDYSGTVPAWTSAGSTHTLSIPIASTGATGLISTQTQSFAGSKTFTNDVFISSSTASTWAANGALRVQGGLGVSGQLSFNQAALGYTGASNPSISFIGGTTGTPITMTVLSDNSLIFEGTSGKLFGINNNLSSGWIFNVGDISGLPLIRANADGTIAMTEFAGNVGIGMSNPAYKLHVAGSVGFTSSVGSSTVTTGALIVSGGVGIGNSVSVGGRLQLFNGSNFTAFVSSATGNTVYTLPATSPATGSSVLSSTSGGVLSWVPMTSGSSSGTVNAGTANYAAYYATSSSAVSENANLQFTGTGLSVGGNIESTSTRSGSLYVTGGLGVTGNAFIGGTTTVQNSASSVSSSTGALVVSGGVGIGGSLFAATSIAANSGANGLSLQKAVGASLGAVYSTNVSPSVSNYSLATDGNNLNLNSVSNLYLNISNTVKATLTTNNFAVNINVASTNSTSGAFTVSGGAGIAGSLYVGNASRFEASTASISSGTGALTVTGGAGIGGSLYVASASRFESSAASISTSSGAIVVSGGVGIGGSLYTGGPSRFSDSTQSTSINTGALVVTGGAAVGQSVSIGGRLQMFNGSNFTAFVSSASGNTVYTLPATSPATGTSILQSTSDGVMSWVPMVSGGSVSPGGSSGQLQYNNGGSFGGITGLVYSNPGSGTNFVVNTPADVNGGTFGILNIGPRPFDGLSLGQFVGSILGTVVAINAGVGFSGNFLDFQNNGVSGFAVSSNGKVVIGNNVWSLPTTAGSAGQVLTSNGNGTQATWTTVSSSAPGGTLDGSVQFKVGSGFAGTRDFYWNDTYKSLRLGNFPGEEITSGTSAALLIEQAIGSFNGNNAGNLIGVNALSTFTGDLINLQTNAVTRFRVGADGGMGVSSLSSSGNVIVTSTTNSTSSADGALVVSGGVGIGKTLSVASNIQFNGTMYAGNNTFAKNLGAGDISLDNGSSDTPSITFYWGNNRNIGIDTYWAGSGATRFRITKELNESGGGELWSVDRNGIVTQTAWDVGETINTRMYNNSDLSMSATTTISNSTYTTVATISYTPKSTTSYLWIEFDAHYDFNNGTTADDFFSRITVGGSSIMEKNQIFLNAPGGGTRSGTLFPISGRYTNTGTSALTINIQARQGTADDSIRVYGSTTSGYLRIQEIGR